MTTRSALLAAAALGLATPAAAQHSDHHSPSGHGDATGHHADQGYEGEWQGEWVDGDHYQGEWEGTYHGDAYRAHQHHGRDVRHLGASPDGRLGYTLAERESWLADCRLLMAYGGGYDDGYHYDERRGADGRVIGGLLGAAAGGVVGNRVADGNRTAGTLLGAGLGGLAGYAIGGAIDDRDDRAGFYGNATRDEIWAARYCDAYLRRYEMGGGAGTWGQVQPVMMVAMAPHGNRGHRHSADCSTVVTEEIIEIEEAPAPRPRRARRAIARPAPAAEPGKVTPIN